MVQTNLHFFFPKQDSVTVTCNNLAKHRLRATDLFMFHTVLRLLPHYLFSPQTQTNWSGGVKTAASQSKCGPCNCQGRHVDHLRGEDVERPNTCWHRGTRNSGRYLPFANMKFSKNGKEKQEGNERNNMKRRLFFT